MSNLARQLEYTTKEYSPNTEERTPVVDTENRIVEGVVSTIYQDRDREIVLPSAFERDLETYFTNPILLLFHGHKTLPVGKCLDIKINPETVTAKFQIAPTPTGDEVMTLLEGGFLRGFSTGFIPIDFVETPGVDLIPQIAIKTAMGRPCKR